MLTLVALLVALSAFRQQSPQFQTIAAANLAQSEAVTIDTLALTGAPEHR